jgi:hypothetical protein
VYFRRLGNKPQLNLTLERQKDDGNPSGFEWFNCTPVRVNRKLQNDHPVIFFRLSSAKQNMQMKTERPVRFRTPLGV